MSIRVIDTILRPELIKSLQAPEEDESKSQHEKRMVSVATLIVNLMKDTIIKIQKHQIRELDANPGDLGCQKRALHLRKILMQPAVLAELKELDKSIKALDALMQTRRTRPGADPTAVFFEKHIAPIQVSPEMMYLLECRLLTVTKVKDHVEPTGVVVTKLDYGVLRNLSSNLDCIKYGLREKIISEAAVRMSEKSIALLQEEGKMRTISPLLERMLNTVRQNKPSHPYKPKSFGCILYEMQMILIILREQQALIAIKTVVPKGKPQMIFLRPPAPGEDFRVVDIAALPKTELVVVFEGVVQEGLSLQELGARVEQIGFTRLILACSAMAAPFEHGSTLEDVDDLEARAEIAAHRSIAREIGPLIELDHIFCNSIQEELKSC
jgi:hypothetical protein